MCSRVRLLEADTRFLLPVSPVNTGSPDAYLETHLLDYARLAAAHYVDDQKQPLSGPALLDKLKPDFERFLEWRARRVAVAAAKLAQGEIPTCKAVLAEAEAKSVADSPTSGEASLS